MYFNAGNEEDFRKLYDLVQGLSIHIIGPKRAEIVSVNGKAILRSLDGQPILRQHFTNHQKGNKNPYSLEPLAVGFNFFAYKIVSRTNGETPYWQLHIETYPQAETEKDEKDPNRKSLRDIQKMFGERGEYIQRASSQRNPLFKAESLA